MYIALRALSRKTEWIDAFEVALPSAKVVRWNEADLESVEFVVGWFIDAGSLARLPRLKAVLISGAGFDHLDLDGFPDVPLVRLVDPAMVDDIALYCLSWVIHFQRDFDVYRQAQAGAEWTQLVRQRVAADYTVGVLGRGAVGAVVMETCERHGFSTIGWSRSDHDRNLLDFFAASDVVINLVPGSPQTDRLIGAAELAALGDGVLVNVGRGRTVDDDALLTALAGPMRAAVLDVFVDEPLAKSSPFWNHPKITVTPHIAGRTNPRTAAPVIARNIERIIAGEAPFPLVEVTNR